MANIFPEYCSDKNHVLHRPTRFAAKRGKVRYVGFGCYRKKCAFPNLSCKDCNLSFGLRKNLVY